MKALTSKDESYAVVKHMINDHPGRQPDFSYKIDRSWKTSLQRQIHEAIKIEETDPSDKMNSRSEWGANCVPRVKINQHSDRADADRAAVRSARSGSTESTSHSGAGAGDENSSKRAIVTANQGQGQDQRQAKRQRDTVTEEEGLSTEASLQRSMNPSLSPRQSNSLRSPPSGSRSRSQNRSQEFADQDSATPN